MPEIVRGDGMKYVLSYNAFHNLQSIGIDGKPENLISYTYKNGNGRLKQVTYANGDTMKATYDSVGHMVSEKWYNASGVQKAHYLYGYDGQGNIVRSLDIFAQKEYDYIYDDGHLIYTIEYAVTLTGEFVTGRTIVATVRYFYDKDGKLSKKVVLPASGTPQTTNYKTDEDDNTTVSFAVPEPTAEDPENTRTVTCRSKADSFGRKAFDEIQIGCDFISRQYAYAAGRVTDEHKATNKVKSSPTTQLVSQIVFSGGRTVSYEYDEEERITRVTDSADGVTEYTYDALGQLLTEKKTKNGTTTVVNTMTYDAYGNITSRNGKAYTYGNTVWRDLLTAYNGQSIDYDFQGNPTSYLGHTLTWEKGRQLKSFDNNTYTYNAKGIRTSKTVNGVKHTYTLEGTKILCEAWGDNTLIPLRDNTDSICGILYNNVPYYFQRNLQGDIIGILNKDAETVATYAYDAWGVCSIVTDTSDCAIADINPFRYRGYYYDEEIGLYYLQSRYYDPDIGRFVNEDEIQNITTLTGVNLNNLYGYCINNPILYYDKNGQYPILAGGGLQVCLSISFGGLSVSAGFELIYFWTKNFNTKYSSRFLLYLYYDVFNFNISTLKNAIDINWYYRRMSFNPKKLISKPAFNAAVSILTLWIDHKASIDYRDYEKRFDTKTMAGFGKRAFRSWSDTFTVIGFGKYWGISGSGISRSVSMYLMICDIGNSMKELMESIKRQAKSQA